MTRHKNVGKSLPGTPGRRLDLYEMVVATVALAMGLAAVGLAVAALYYDAVRVVLLRVHCAKKLTRGAQGKRKP
jgi:hypothetical protein